MSKKRIGMLFGLGALAILFIGMQFVGITNGLVEKEAGVDGRWAQVENVLQRRNDLIPNLVGAVEGSMSQERQVFGAIADARNMASSATTVDETAEANAELTNQLQTLVNVIHESYPELASNENVQSLMVQLEGTENRIAVERQRYNETVTDYNVTIRKFPTSIIANIAGYDKKELFKMAEGADVAPVVEFNTGG